MVGVSNFVLKTDYAAFTKVKPRTYGPDGYLRAADDALPLSVLSNFPAPDWESKCDDIIGKTMNRARTGVIWRMILVLVFVILAAVIIRFIQ
jgi:hypothetical protein